MFLSLILSCLCPWPVCESASLSVCFCFSPVSYSLLSLSLSCVSVSQSVCFCFSPVSYSLLSLSLSCESDSQSVCFCFSPVSISFLSCLCHWPVCESASLSDKKILSCLYYSLLSVCPGLFVSLFVCLCFLFSPLSVPGLFVSQ